MTIRNQYVLGVFGALCLLLGACGGEAAPTEPWSVYRDGDSFTLVDPEGSIVKSSDVRFEQTDGASAGSETSRPLDAVDTSEIVVQKRLVVIECDICIRDDSGGLTCFNCHAV